MCGALGYWVWKIVELLLSACKITFWGWANIFFEIACISALAVAGYFIGGPVSRWLAHMLSKLTKKAKEMPAKEMFLGLAGLLIGFVCAFLICQIFDNISNEVLVTCINALVYICCGFLGFRVFIMRRDDVEMFEKNARGVGEQKSTSGGTLLDSSILIDGRTVDIFKTGFLNEPLYVPQFILDELTKLADSEDNKKRTRGRLGLDTVKKLQEIKCLTVLEKEVEGESIDAKLINTARQLNADIMTNDYSLNMVASVQGVKILNVNELVNALKPTVIAGDEITVEISKTGKDPLQGVGYLDDGTMIVVEDGAKHIDSFVEVVVTGMLQTNAGKIIFAKLKNQ